MYQTGNLSAQLVKLLPFTSLKMKSYRIGVITKAEQRRQTSENILSHEDEFVRSTAAKTQCFLDMNALKDQINIYKHKMLKFVIFKRVL